MTSFKINPYLFSTIFLVLALSVSTAFAQKVWTLEDCINYAFENNIQIKQSKLQIESVQADLKQSKFEFAPSLNGSSSLNYSWGRSIDPITNTYINTNNMSTSFGVNSGITLLVDFKSLMSLNKMSLPIIRVFTIRKKWRMISHCN